MNRFAMLTFATTVTAIGATVAACSSDQGSGSQFYGTPPCIDQDRCESVQDSGSAGALYGLPGTLDSGSPRDASFDAGDAMTVDGSGDAGDDAD
jgi:hypothetical protein